MLRERLQVLHDSSEVELIARAAKAPETHVLEAMMGLQVGEAHFDPLPLIAGSLRRFHESDLSLKFHPAAGRIRSSIGPIRSGVATGRGAKPPGERSALACYEPKALRAA